MVPDAQHIAVNQVLILPEAAVDMIPCKASPDTPRGLGVLQHAADAAYQTEGMHRTRFGDITLNLLQ